MRIPSDDPIPPPCQPQYSHHRQSSTYPSISGPTPPQFQSYVPPDVKTTTYTPCPAPLSLDLDCSQGLPVDEILLPYLLQYFSPPNPNMKQLNICDRNAIPKYSGKTCPRCFLVRVVQGWITFLVPRTLWTSYFGDTLSTEVKTNWYSITVANPSNSNWDRLVLSFLDTYKISNAMERCLTLLNEKTFHDGSTVRTLKGEMENIIL